MKGEDFSQNAQPVGFRVDNAAHPAGGIVARQYFIRVDGNTFIFQYMADGFGDFDNRGFGRIGLFEIAGPEQGPLRADAGLRGLNGLL